jgi:hypothetical protein
VRLEWDVLSLHERIGICDGEDSWVWCDECGDGVHCEVEDASCTLRATVAVAVVGMTAMSWQQVLCRPSCGDVREDYLEVLLLALLQHSFYTTS